ncbi:MAG: hypothetical protein JNK11_13610 [Alphaproteobacteria bacterium]|nr:hypothetical protein [Alphaproteobacteria bacterium]
MSRLHRALLAAVAVACLVGVAAKSLRYGCRPADLDQALRVSAAAFMAERGFRAAGRVRVTAGQLFAADVYVSDRSCRSRLSIAVLGDSAEGERLNREDQQAPGGRSMLVRLGGQAGGAAGALDRALAGMSLAPARNVPATLAVAWTSVCVDPRDWNWDALVLRRIWAAPVAAPALAPLCQALARIGD